MPAPLVSVVVPAFNGMPWIRQTLDSICAQTLVDFEVIVVDDGSTDDTAAFVRDYERRDSRVRCICKRNEGLAKARNDGMRLASGRFVSFLDADDLWAPDKLQRQVGLVNGRTDTAVLSGVRRFVETDGEYQWLSETVPIAGSGHSYLRALLSLRSNEMVCVATALAPLTAWRDLGGYDPELATAEDWDMWLRAARHLNFVVVPGQPLQFYRKRAGSLTAQSNLERDFAAWRAILLKQTGLGGATAAEVRRAIAKKRLETADMARVQGRAGLALESLFLSVADPSVLLRSEIYRSGFRLIRGK